MRYAARVDANHAELKLAFEKMGASVLDLSRVGNGCPDLAVSLHTITVFVEVKTAKGYLTPDQRRFHRESKATIHEARSVEDVVRIVAGMKAKMRQSAAAEKVDTQNLVTIVHSAVPRMVYLCSGEPRTSAKHLQQQKESYTRHTEERRIKALRRWHKRQRDVGDESKS